MNRKAIQSTTSCQRDAAPGFTLIELLVVIFIIGILAAILVPLLWPAINSSRRAATLATFSALAGPLAEYQERTRRYPAGDADDLAATLVEELERLQLARFSDQEVGPHPGDPGRVVLVDGWGNPIRYRPFYGLPPAMKAGAHNPRTYDIWSAGPDGDPDTWEDNMFNWR